MFFRHVMYPKKLKRGDEVRVLSPAMSLEIVRKPQQKKALKRLEDLGFRVTFSEHVSEYDDFESSSIEHRVADLHAAFADKNVAGIIATDGGFNSNQLLRYLDYSLIRKHPKILCGYSDITALSNAIFAKTGVVGYSGPLFSSFGQPDHFEYSLEYFQKCVMSSDPFEVTPSEEWSDWNWEKHPEEMRVEKNLGPYIIQDGQARGTIIGGNLSTLALLQGTEYMPNLKNTILFLEDDYEFLPHHFDRALQGLIHLPAFSGVQAIVWGRCDRASKMTRELMTQINKNKKELHGLPIIADVDFGHTDPRCTFPIGGVASLDARHGRIKLVIEKH